MKKVSSRIEKIELFPLYSLKLTQVLYEVNLSVAHSECLR